MLSKSTFLLKSSKFEIEVSKSVIPQDACGLLSLSLTHTHTHTGKDP